MHADHPGQLSQAGSDLSGAGATAGPCIGGAAAPRRRHAGLARIRAACDRRLRPTRSRRTRQEPSSEQRQNRTGPSFGLRRIQQGARAGIDARHLSQPLFDESTGSLLGRGARLSRGRDRTERARPDPRRRRQGDPAAGRRGCRARHRCRRGWHLHAPRLPPRSEYPARLRPARHPSGRPLPASHVRPFGSAVEREFDGRSFRRGCMTAFHRKIQANAEFACRPSLLYEILTDYDSYKDWMPKVRASALLARAGELAIARLDFAPGEEYASLECIHTHNRSVLSRAIEGQLQLRSLEWTLEPLSGDRSRVTLVLEGQTRLPIGSGRADLLNADAILSALKGYTGAFMPELVFEGVQGEVALEIFETENGLVCWFNGQEYEMRPVRKFSK